MMYRCENCGHLYEEGEQAVWYENQGECHGVTAMERFSGCPLCHDDYKEVHQCKECGDWHTENELYDGWCEKCLRETINYDTFFEYCEANKDERYLDIFVMCDMLNCDEAPEFPSYEFHQIMIDNYKAVAKIVTDWEKQNGRRHPDAFIDGCIRFIMDDDGSIGRENYANWLNKREARK